MLWQGAEYRGRGRETLWNGTLKISGNRIARFAPVNFLNPERKVVETEPGTLTWTSVTTGNLAGIDLWLDAARAGLLSIETNIVSGDRRPRHARGSDDCLRRRRTRPAAQRLSLAGERLEPSLQLEHTVRFPGGADLPVWLRVTQADGNQAWTSPIYLIA